MAMTDTGADNSVVARLETKGPLKQLGAPRVAFLGFCDRSVEIQHGFPALWHQNLIGLSTSSRLMKNAN